MVSYDLGNRARGRAQGEGPGMMLGPSPWCVFVASARLEFRC